jgi:putative transposase
MLRRVIYTTNAIESLNYQLRKVTKNRGHFPSDDAVVKLLWLGDLQYRRQTGPRTREATRPTTQRTHRRRPPRRRPSHH